MAKELLWNGSARCLMHGDFPSDASVYIAAYSLADARRVCMDAGLPDPGRGEIVTYWTKGCWGLAMNGITPERGIWAVPAKWRHGNPATQLLPLARTGDKPITLLMAPDAQCDHENGEYLVRAGGMMLARAKTENEAWRQARHPNAVDAQLLVRHYEQRDAHKRVTTPLMRG